MAQDRCPSCGNRVSALDFQCPRCELLLNAEADPPSGPGKDPSVVRALLSIPEKTPGGGVPAPPELQWDQQATERYALPLESDEVPKLLAGMDVALQPLHPFEAYIVSLLDGAHSVHELAQLASLRDIEVGAVLRSLLDRGVIAVPEPPLAVTQPLEDAPAPTDPAQIAVPPPPPTAQPLPRARAAAPPPPPPRPAPAPPPPLPRAALHVPSSGSALNASRHALNPLQRAVELERRGDVEAAIKVLERGIAGTRAPAPLYNRLALILINQRQDLREAEKLLRKATRLEPNNDVYEKNLIKVLTLQAADSGPKRKSGFLARLTGKK